MKPLKGSDIVPAWRAARSRTGVNKLAGQVYAEALRRGRVPSASNIAATCGTDAKQAEKALAALRAADLIPGKVTRA